MPDGRDCNGRSSPGNRLRHAGEGRRPGARPGPSADEPPGAPPPISHGGKSSWSKAKVNGVELEYEVQGTGEPVLLIGTGPIADSFLPFRSEPGAGRPLPLDHVPPAGPGRQHAQPAAGALRGARGRRRGAARPPGRPAGPRGRALDRARPSPSSWPPTAPSSCTRWPCWSRSACRWAPRAPGPSSRRRGLRWRRTARATARGPWRGS